MYIKLNKTCLFTFFLLINFGLFSQTKFTTKKAGNTITFSVPNYLVKTNTLNDAAILQYMNASKEAYVIVIDDSKSDLELAGSKFEDIKEFHDSVSEKLKSTLKEINESELNIFEKEGKNYCQSVITGMITTSESQEIEITYLLTYLETEENYYQILCWSTTENFPKMETDYRKISLSLVEQRCN
jgi:ribosomal protein L13